MPTPIDLIEAQAMTLTADERADLADRLYRSVSAAPDLDSRWEAEIDRRLDDMDAGRTRFMPASEAMAKLAAHIQSRRPTGGV
jgi:putative addiction module component (TIGR02574 family)